MSNKSRKPIAIIFFLFITIAFIACQEGSITKMRKKFNIKNLFSKLKKEKAIDKSDTTNIFDNDNYDPSLIDSNELMQTLETVYESDSALIKKIGIADSAMLTKNNFAEADSNAEPIKNDSFSSDIKKVASTEIKALKYNLDQLKNEVKFAPIDSLATQAKCKVWADVSKKDQRLYLYIDGVCMDTFKVSTGDAKHKTPNINRRPSGPQFTKYTSKKYPGGNYNGLGNMPYVLFVQGGYGIHGTTIGNIKRLGTPASHGCVRVHPDNGKILFEIVKAVGIENTWVTIRE